MFKVHKIAINQHMLTTIYHALSIFAAFQTHQAFEGYNKR